MSVTVFDLLRQALVAKLAVDLGRPHRATHAAEQADRLASRLVAELAPARAREEQWQDLDDEDDDDLADLLDERYPRPAEDDGPAGCDGTEDGGG